MADYGMPLSKYDNIPEFVVRMLKGDHTYGINFDRILWHSGMKCYVLIEYLLCDEKQFPRGINPYTSHPSRYFTQNPMKFISLWEYTQLLKGKLYLVNYSKKGTQYDDLVLLMEVKSVDESAPPYVITNDIQMTRSTYSEWLRGQNKWGK